MSCPLLKLHTAVTCPVTGVGNSYFSNRAALKSAVNAYTSTPRGTTYDGGTKSLTALGDIGTWCTSGITDMSSLFLDKVNFNERIGSWDTSSVKNMNSMESPL